MSVLQLPECYISDWGRWPACKPPTLYRRDFDHQHCMDRMSNQLLCIPWPSQNPPTTHHPDLIHLTPPHPQVSRALPKRHHQLHHLRSHIISHSAAVDATPAPSASPSASPAASPAAAAAAAALAQLSVPLSFAHRNGLHDATGKLLLKCLTLAELEEWCVAVGECVSHWRVTAE